MEFLVLGYEHTERQQQRQGIIGMHRAAPLPLLIGPRPILERHHIPNVLNLTLPLTLPLTLGLFIALELPDAKSFISSLS